MMDFSFQFLFTSFCAAAYSLEEIEKKTKDLRAAPYRYKVPDDAPALDVSVSFVLCGRSEISLVHVQNFRLTYAKMKVLCLGRGL